MWTVDIRLVDKDWKKCEYESHEQHLLGAFRAAKVNILRQLHRDTAEFWPLGNNEFVIWADGKCQGYLGLKQQEQGDEN